MIIAHCLRVHLYGVAGYDIAGRLAERVVERLGALEPEIFNTAAV